MPITFNNDNLIDYFSKMENLIDWFFQDPLAKQMDFDYFMPYFFKDRGSKTLLVTVGDSWTWGSDLAGYPDFGNFCVSDWEIVNRGIKNINQNRIEYSYGNILSELMTADWLNLSCAAYGNFHISARVKELATIIPNLTYNNIIVVCVLTEPGRHFNTSDDTIVDHKKLFEQFRSIENFLSDLNQISIKQIVSSLLPYKHVKLLVGTNNVDQIGFDSLSNDQRLHTPWYRLLGIDRKKPIFAYSELAGKSLVRSIDDKTIPPEFSLQFQQWVMEVFDNEKIVNRESRRSPFFCKYSIFPHTNKPGHVLWAEHVFERIQNDKQS